MMMMMMISSNQNIVNCHEMIISSKYLLNDETRTNVSVELIDEQETRGESLLIYCHLTCQRRFQLMINQTCPSLSNRHLQNKISQGSE